MGAMKALRLDRHIRAQAPQNYTELERRAAERERQEDKALLFLALYGNNAAARRRAIKALRAADRARAAEAATRQADEAEIRNIQIGVAEVVRDLRTEYPNSGALLLPTNLDEASRIYFPELPREIVDIEAARAAEERLREIL